MIRTIRIIVGLCTLIGLSHGCSTDPELSAPRSVVEGEPAEVAVTFRKSEPDIVKTGTTRAVDDDIKHVYILIFDAGAGHPLKTLYSNAYAGGTILISTRSGESMIYAVTNVGQNPLIAGGNTIFDDVASLSDFQKKMASLKVVSPASGQVLPMSGQTAANVIITPGNNATNINIPVQRLTAKISLQVVIAIPPTDKIDLISWEVMNTPAFSYIDPRTGSDAVKDRPQAPGDSNYFQSPPQLFSPVLLLPGNTQVPGAEFYMFENRKGEVPSVNSQLKRASQAPAKATFINVKARYQNTTEVKNVTYRVHLGTNNLTNYDVSRNTHHTYTMTIKGLTQYSTNVVVTNQDSRVVIGDTIFAVDLFEPILDAHYDWRPIRLRAVPGYSRIEVVDNMGTPVSTSNSWLKLSLNKTWPTNAELAANVALTPTTKLDGLQHIAGTSSKTVYLYANEMFINDVPITAERTLNLRLTFTPSANPANLNIPDSCYTVTRVITQRPALTMGNMGIRPTDILGNIVPGNGNIMAVERRDEFSMQLAASGLAATPLNGMRWGFNGIVKQPLTNVAFEFYRTNGWDNTVAMVYNPGGILLNQTNIADLGTPPYSGDFDPIYNTYAARYALEKNRDLDGNGKIEGNEIKWFFPSRAELMLMWIGKMATNAAANEKMVESYWGSSESGAFLAINMNFYNGGTGGDISKNTINHVRAVRKMTDPNPGSLKSPYVVGGTRQITGLPSGVSSGHPAHIKGRPFPIHSAEDALNTVSPTFEIARQDAGLNGIPAPISGTVFMEWYQAAGWTPTWQTTPTVANPATGCNAYWEVSPTDPARGVGMWRMPTQRELMTIWMLRKELLYDGFQPLAPTKYWSAPNYYSESWFTDFSSGYTGVPKRNASDPPFQFNVRCVRDVTP